MTLENRFLRAKVYWHSLTNNKLTTVSLCEFEFGDAWERKEINLDTGEVILQLTFPTYQEALQ